MWEEFEGSCEWQRDVLPAPVVKCDGRAAAAAGEAAWLQTYSTERRVKAASTAPSLAVKDQPAADLQWSYIYSDLI